MADRLPDLPDVWAPAGTEGLPPRLVAAYRALDWTTVSTELARVMDGAVTDGAYGRQLLQLVLGLPPGDAVFNRYRIAAMLDHGDWDGLRVELPAQTIEPLEISGKRDILTAPVDRTGMPHHTAEHQRLLFEVCESQARNDARRLRRWAQRIGGQYPEALWSRPDIAIGRHLRFRQLHDLTMLAVAEAQAGRLVVSQALSIEAARLGDEGEPLRVVATDLAGLTRLAMGDRQEVGLLIPSKVASPRGPSPLGVGELILYVLPLLALRNDESLNWSAKLLGYIAARLAAPRWQLQADSWRVASELRVASSAGRTEIAGLLARARRATPGLKALPVFLASYAGRRVDGFEESATLARQSGNVWLQISALTWMTALDPTPRTARRLRQLLDITGWRRPVMVPTEIAADAALGMTSLGERSESILEMALVADRPNVTTALVAKYVDDTTAPIQTRLAAVDTLNRVGTTHAREILARYAQRHDEVGKAAARKAARPAFGLSEREIEVLGHAADGMTNRQIAEKLFLSPHTVARHLANARAKLGAANRAEAAVRLHRVAD